MKKIRVKWKWPQRSAVFARPGKPATRARAFEARTTHILRYLSALHRLPVYADAHLKMAYRPPLVGHRQHDRHDSERTRGYRAARAGAYYVYR